jgi:hypothetical protein
MVAMDTTLLQIKVAAVVVALLNLVLVLGHLRCAAAMAAMELLLH